MAFELSILEGNRLYAEPRSILTPTDVAFLRQWKRHILAMLQLGDGGAQ